MSYTLRLLISFDSSASSILSVGLEAFTLSHVLIKSFICLDSLLVKNFFPALLPLNYFFTALGNISEILLFTASTLRLSSSVKAEYVFCSEILNYSTSPLTANLLMDFFTSLFRSLFKSRLIWDLTNLWSLHHTFLITSTCCTMPGLEHSLKSILFLVSSLGLFDVHFRLFRFLKKVFMILKLLRSANSIPTFCYS